ncbi:protein serine/threonine phosphatase [Aureococcus anophagefferens]|nr:protein serine/threonine phosphatase [Aureococcus anophagefferens]
MKTTTVDLSDGFRFRYVRHAAGFYPHDRKKANQDSFVIAHNVGHKSHHFFGVFDGHGPTGDACSLFAREHQEDRAEKVKGQSANVPAALTDAYEKANRRLKKSPHDDSLSGTTAICVFSSGRKLYAGNAATSLRCSARPWEPSR